MADEVDVLDFPVDLQWKTITPGPGERAYMYPTVYFYDQQSQFV